MPHSPDRLTRREFTSLVLAGMAMGTSPIVRGATGKPSKKLYVASPGIRDDLQYGGHGLLVFDIDNGHRFVKRIATAGKSASGKPENVKGVCASAHTKLIHISTLRTLTCINLESEAILWERPYEGGCDRMALSPDGTVIYLPSFEKDHWHVLEAKTGEIIGKIVPKSGAHNTVYGRDGKHVYLAGLKSPLLTVAETATHKAERTIGPFSASIRPFTVNGAQTLCYINVNELLGFEVGDLTTGKKTHRVEVQGFSPGPVKRHGCPSHGIGLTPDEKELWVADGHNQRMHVFDATVMPPKHIESLKLRDEPGWVTFGLDGRFAYPSTGQVFDVASKKLVTALSDEMDRTVMSEKMVEITFDGEHPVDAADQFGLGRVTKG